MIIRLDTRNYVTHHYSLQPFTYNTVIYDGGEIAKYIQARNRSLGLKSDNAKELATLWQHKPKQSSFLSMTQMLLSKLTLPCDRVLELVLFCHWSTDCEFGHSISNYIVEQCGAENAFAFAISDAGPIAPFLAYSIIHQWSLSFNYALLIIVDQSSHLHQSSLLSDHLQDNVGAAMVWSSTEGNGLASGYYPTFINSDLSINEWFAVLQSVCPFDVTKALFITDTYSQKYCSVGLIVSIFDDEAPSAWPFHLAKRWLVELSDDKASISGLVLCRTYRNTTHFLWFYSEKSHENN